MKSKSRVLLLGLISLVLAGSFALFGCSSDDNNNTGEQQSSNNEEQTPTPAPESSNDPVELQIFAANSLTMAMDEIQELYKKDHDWVSFADTQYKSSGELNEMLGAGSSADILITASKGTMDTAVDEGYVDESSRFDMFTNDLVIVANENSDLTDVTLEDIANGTYSVAVGDDSVPAGNYAAQALSTLGAYDDPSGNEGSEADGKEGDYVGISPQLQTSVGNVCQLAASDEVDVAIVYSSDVQRFEGVKQVGVIPDDTHKPIIYPGAVCVDSELSDEAQAFLDWCVSDPDAIKIWQEWGFTLA